MDFYNGSYFYLGGTQHYRKIGRSRKVLLLVYGCSVLIQRAFWSGMIEQGCFLIVFCLIQIKSNFFLLFFKLLDRDPWHLVAENLEIPKEPNYLGDIGDLATSLSYLSFNLRIRHTDLKVLHFIHKALAKTRRTKMFVWMLQKMHLFV